MDDKKIKDDGIPWRAKVELRIDPCPPIIVGDTGEGTYSKYAEIIRRLRGAEPDADTPHIV